MGVGTDKKSLEPWEKKLIGRKSRYTDSWLGWIAAGVWWAGEGYFDSAMNGLYKYLADLADPEVKQHALYGKKLDRPWGTFSGWGRNSLGALLRSEGIQQSLNSAIKRSMMNPNELQYVSGDVVAATCFIPAAMDKDKRPPIRFEDNDLIAFYNELGIIPDENAILVDMFQETIKVKDANFTDAQWRTYIMPIIISESYKRQLNIVYDILQKEYMNTPAMSKNMLSERMDKAQQLLGKMYQGFSRSLANNTEYLEAPLNILESDVPHKLPEKLEKTLSAEEQKKYSAHVTKALVAEDELQDFKERVININRPDRMEDYVHAFYRSLSGNVGRVSKRTESFHPKAIAEDHSDENVSSFINAVAALKNCQRVVAKSKKAEDLEHLELMKQNFAALFSVDPADVEEMLKPETALEEIRIKYAVTDEALFGYKKVDYAKQLSDIAEKEQFVYKFKTTVEQKYNDLKKLWKEGIDFGEIKVDLKEEDIDEDLFGDADERMADRKAKQELLEAKRKEAERLERERWEKENAERIKEAEKQRQEREEAARKAEQKNEALKDLEPWQKKLIGHEIRYSHTWMGAFRQDIYKDYGKSIDQYIDNLLQYLGDNMDPGVHRYKVYGRKLDRPWGYKAGAQGFAVSTLLKMNFTASKLKLLAQKALMAPGVPLRVKGETVALACFAPSFIQGEKRPPCHFDKALMAKFYNETGIMVDEAAIIADMMDETLSIDQKIYTDEQWRKELMPQIIKGSYQKQLQTVCGMLRQEYLGNPAMSKEMFRERMEKASRALGELYQDFTRALANTTEYLEAPMKILDTDKKQKFPKEINSVLTDEQKDLASGYKMRSITSKRKIRAIIDQEAEVERPETVGSLLEQFYMATSGVVGAVTRAVDYTPKAFRADERDMQNERSMIAALAVAKKMTALLASKEKNRGFFSWLFKVNEPAQERLAVAAMKEKLAVYGFSEAQLDDMLNPKKSLDDVKKELGITDETICGIRKIEIPPSSSETLEDRQKTFADYVRDRMGKYAPVVDYAIGGVKLVGNGIQWVASKTVNWMYHTYSGGTTDEVPKEEKIAEFSDQRHVDEVAKESEKEAEEPVKEPEQLSEEPEREMVQPAVDTIENAEGEVFYEAEEELEDLVEGDVPENDAEEQKQEAVIEDNKESQEEVKEEIQEEKKEETDEQVNLEDLEETEEPEGIEDELVKDLGTDSEAQNQGWMSWGWSMVSSAASYVTGVSQQTKAEDVQAKISETRTQIVSVLEGMDGSDKDAMYVEMARLACLGKLNQAVTSGRVKPEQAMKGLENNRLEKYTTKFVENPGFRILCDKMIRKQMAKQMANVPQASNGPDLPPTWTQNAQNQMQTDMMPKLTEHMTQVNKEKL